MSPLRLVQLGTCLLLAGCWGGPAPGVITGVVTYDGKPAPGKRVTLVGGEGKTVATDANGRYTFNNVAARRYQISYRSEGDRAEALPNEIASWRSAGFDMVEGSGKEVPTIEVAYNGLLYPEAGMALLISEKDLVPFHWSTHPRGQRYRVTVEGENKAFKWTSPWVGEPMATFGQAVSPGRYTWTVEIDGGDSGTGLSRPRQVDF